MSDSAPRGWSLLKTAVAVSAALGLFAWVILAAQYAEAAEGWAAVTEEQKAAAVTRREVARIGLRRVRSGATLLAGQSLWGLVTNAAGQVPNAHRVAWFSVTERPILSGFFALLIAAPPVGAWLLRGLDAELSGSRPRASERPVRRPAPARESRRRKPPPGFDGR